MKEMLDLNIIVPKTDDIINDVSNIIIESKESAYRAIDILYKNIFSTVLRKSFLSRSHYILL